MTDMEAASARLRALARGGEQLVEVVERLAREAEANGLRADHAAEREREVRRMFAAAVLSQPSGALEVTSAARHALWSDYELVSVEDLARERLVYRVLKRRR